MKPGTETGGPYTGTKKWDIGMSLIDLTNPFYTDMKQAAEQAAKDYGVNITYANANDSLETQLAQVNNFIAQKKDIILINAIDDNGIEPALKKAEAAGIPVIMMANDVKDPNVYKTLYPDYSNMAMQARILGTWLGGKGTVALLTGTPGNSVSDSRQAGFLDTMKKEFPDIKVVATLVTNFDGPTGANVARTLFAQHPDISGVSCVTDPPCNAAIAVAQAKHLDNIAWVSYDGNPPMVKYLQDGTTLVDVLTGAQRVGYWNVALASRILAGSQFPKTVYLPTYFVSASNIAEKLKGEGLTYPFITPNDEAAKSTGYSKQMGPGQPDKALDQGSGESAQ